MDLADAWLGHDHQVVLAGRPANLAVQQQARLAVQERQLGLDIERERLAIVVDTDRLDVDLPVLFGAQHDLALLQRIEDADLLLVELFWCRHGSSCFACRGATLTMDRWRLKG